MNTRNYPKVNIASLIQRANDLITVCTRDKEYLMQYGLTNDMIDELDRLFVQSEQALVDHAMCRDTLDEKQLKLDIRSKEAYKLRSKLADHIRRAGKLLRVDISLPSYGKRKQQADLVQDLHDLATLARTHKDLLMQKQFDVALIDQAFTLSDTFSQEIVAITVYRGCTLEDAMRKRNELFYQMRQLMTDLCVIGRDAFKDNPAALKNYARIR